MAALSLTSDYATSTGCPQPYLQRIAEAGFTHVHWCHHWCTDFLYADCEIEQIARWLAEFGLAVTDLHASAGAEKRWTSPRDYERLAGVELVANRIRMAGRLGSDVVILHLIGLPDDPAQQGAFWDRVWASLDDLAPVAAGAGVRIALENGHFDQLEACLGRYGADFLGLCYDCGHGNMIPDGLDRLEAVRDRLISIHLHDNDGQNDQHLPPFRGTVDWPRLMDILARSAYARWISMEATMANIGSDDEAAFLAETFQAGTRLSDMLARARAQAGATPPAVGGSAPGATGRAAGGSAPAAAPPA